MFPAIDATNFAFFFTRNGHSRAKAGEEKEGQGKVVDFSLFGREASFASCVLTPRIVSIRGAGPSRHMVSEDGQSTGGLVVYWCR